MTDLCVSYPTSKYESSAGALTKNYCALVSVIKQLFPGSTPQVHHLATTDAVVVSGVSALSPDKINKLRRFSVIDFELKDDTLSLYISRRQRSVCASLCVGVLYIVIGAVCMIQAASRLKI